MFSPRMWFSFVELMSFRHKPLVTNDLWSISVLGYYNSENIAKRNWPDKSTTSYDILDLKSYIQNLQGKYLVI